MWKGEFTKERRQCKIVERVILELGGCDSVWIKGTVEKNASCSFSPQVKVCGLLKKKKWNNIAFGNKSVGLSHTLRIVICYLCESQGKSLWVHVYAYSST